MTLDEFREAHSGAPYTDGEMAEVIIAELDEDGEAATQLIVRAHELLEAQRNFVGAMAEADVEFG